ncbi:hypothetical protein H0H87_009460, partial [Tephrocybe sp. NHM501043]
MPEEVTADAQGEAPREQHLASLQVNDIGQSDLLKESNVIVADSQVLKSQAEDKTHAKRPILSDLKPGDPFMDDPKDTDVIIPIIGITGVGKSSFINILLGEDDVAPVGHTLNSHTDHIQHIAYPHPYKAGCRVVVIDTPGFDHTTVDDREILRRIAVWLARSYDANMKLAGIIYLHEISQGNMSPVRRNLDTFSKLCGPSAIKNVVLATTKWGDIPQPLGDEREKLLRDHHWKDMLDHGSVMFRHEGTQTSAQIIVDQILAQEPLDAVQIQKELIDLNKVLAETEAGLSLFCSLNELLETQKKTAARLRGHESSHPDLRRFMLETDQKIRTTLQQIKRLNHPSLSKRIKHWFERIAWNGICGSDLHAYLTPVVKYANSVPNEVTGETAPVTLGHEFSGTIVALGPDVDASKWGIGTNVVIEPLISCMQTDTCNACASGSRNICPVCNFIGIGGWGGGLAEFIAVDVKYLHVLPIGVSLEIGACIEPLAVAWHAVKRSGFTKGQSALILGAGPVRRVVKVRSFDPSAIIVVSEPTNLRRQQAFKHGATLSLDPLETDIPKAVLRATSGIGVDLAFDAAGIQAGIDVALLSVRPRGTIVNVAVWEKSSILDLNLITFKEIYLTGSASYDRVHAEVLEAVRLGKIPGLEDLITSKISIGEVVEKGFHALLRNKDAH